MVSFRDFTLIQQEELMEWHPSGVKTHSSYLGKLLNNFLRKD